MRMPILFLSLVMILLSGCTKRYWYRTKIDTKHSQKYSVKITIINEIPKHLSDEFVASMRKASLKVLERKGYFELPIDSPQFHYILTIRGATYLYRSNERFGYLDFTCEMRHYKHGWTLWEAADYLEYKKNKRDIPRSRGVVKHLIRAAENHYRLNTN